MLAHRGFPKKASRTARIASDEEIQGSKDAVIQDLERKLRFKEDLLNNGQPVQGAGVGVGGCQGGRGFAAAPEPFPSPRLKVPRRGLTAGLVPRAPTFLCVLRLGSGKGERGEGCFLLPPVTDHSWRITAGWREGREEGLRLRPGVGQ